MISAQSPIVPKTAADDTSSNAKKFEVLMQPFIIFQLFLILNDFEIFL